MNVLLALATAIAAFVLQTSLVPLVAVPAFEPQLVPAALVWMVWRAGPRSGLILASGWGFISDGISQGPLGVDVVIFVLAAWGTQHARCRTPAPAWLSLSAVTGIAAFVIKAGSSAVRMVCERQAVDLPALVAWAGGCAAATFLLSAAFLAARHCLSGSRRTSDRTAPPHVSNRWPMLTE